MTPQNITTRRGLSRRRDFTSKFFDGTPHRSAAVSIAVVPR